MLRQFINTNRPFQGIVLGIGFGSLAGALTAAVAFGQEPHDYDGIAGMLASLALSGVYGVAFGAPPGIVLGLLSAFTPTDLPMDCIALRLLLFTCAFSFPFAFLQIVPLAWIAGGVGAVIGLGSCPGSSRKGPI